VYLYEFFNSRLHGFIAKDLVLLLYHYDILNMTNMHEDSIMGSSHDVLETSLDMDSLDNRLPLEPPLKPF